MTTSLKVLSNFYAPYLEEFDIVLFNGKRHDESYFANQPTTHFSEVIKVLPEGWEPDLVLFHTPFYNRIPVGIEESPWPTVAVLDDWFGGVDYMPDVLGWFDHIVTDLYSQKLLRSRGIENCSYWPSFGHDESCFYQREPAPARDIDVAFLGSFNGNIQFQRFEWLRRVAELPDTNSYLGVGLFKKEYAGVLNRAKIGFNRSIKGEMNLRCFEVPACGALLFIEETNEEIRNFLTPGEECVLYSDTNLEELLHYYLTHHEERERIAEAGRKRIGEFTYRNNYRDLLNQLAEMKIAPGRNRRAGRFYSENADHLHLIQIGLAGGSEDPRIIPRITHFLKTPEGQSPLFLNDMVVLLANYGENGPGLREEDRRNCFLQVVELFNRVLRADPTFVTALFNRMMIKVRLGDSAGGMSDAETILRCHSDSCNGLAFPVDYRFPLRYLWSRALVDPGKYRRIDLLHYFSHLTLADLWIEKEPEKALNAILAALRIFPDMAYGIRIYAQFLRREGREELFISVIEQALVSAPFDENVILCAFAAQEKIGCDDLKKRYIEIVHSLNDGVKRALPGVLKELSLLNS